MTHLASRLKTQHGLIIGERTLEQLQKEVKRLGRQTIRVSGRSAITGKKRVVSVPISKLLG